MVFGSFPFEGKNILFYLGSESEITHKIIKEEIKFPSHISVSETCLNLINGLLEKNSCYRADLRSNLFQDWYEDK